MQKRQMIDRNQRYRMGNRAANRTRALPFEYIIGTRKLWHYSMGLVLLGLSMFWFVHAANAQTESAWQATYWNNQNLSGTPVLQRQTADIRFDWGLGAPDPLVDADSFSARWTRTEQLPEGTYRLSATVDDGIRVWINGIRVIDDWQVGSERTVESTIYLTAGLYETRVEYFEATGAALVMLERTQLDSAPLPVPVTPTALPEPTPISDSTPDLWRAEYYNNRTLGGTPNLVRDENNIDFRWGSGSPAPDLIASDRFSARWTRTIDLAAGRYRFAVTADDGVRLYVNDRLLINEWRDQAATTYTVEATLPGGPTSIRIEYYENADQATARFSYAEVIDDSGAAPTTPANGEQVANWRGEYYDNVNLSGTPLFTRNDNAIAFDWGRGSPAPNALDVDRFSVRWSDTLSLAPGRYRFITVTDDGVRLYLDGELVIDQFSVQSARTIAATYNVTDRDVQVVMEYFEDTGEAVAQLYWERIDSTTNADDAGAALVGPTVTVTGAANLNVRSGPGVQFGIRTTLGRGTVIAPIGRNRTTSWVQVQLADGRTGWVNRTYLSSGMSYRSLPITG